MATAYFNWKQETRTEEKRVVTEVKTEVVDAVTLTLTLDEARLVKALVGQTSGGGALRKLNDAVWQALESIGVGSFGRESFDRTPRVRDYDETPRATYESLPKPKETREDLAGWIG